MSKFATPPPARNLDMSPMLDNATSAAHDAYDDAMLDTTLPNDDMLDTALPDDVMLDTPLPDDAMPDTALPLGAFLDAQIARVAARCDATSKTTDTIEVEPAIMPKLPDMPERYIMEGEIAKDFLACKDSPQDMQEAKKSMREKGIKSEDVKNLPPIEEIHGLDNPIQVGEVNSLRRFDESDIPFDKPGSLCLDEFDNFIAKQESFNDYVSRQLEQNARMLSHLSACMDRNVDDLKLRSKHASMVTTQVEQVLKAQNDLLNELNDNSVRVVTRGCRMTQETLYPEGHPKRIEQDSQGVSTDAPSHPRKKKKDDRNLHASNPVAATPESPNDVSLSDAETQSGDEHEPNDNINSDVRDDAQPSNDKDVEIEPVDLDNPQRKNRRYDKNDFAARKHGDFMPFSTVFHDIVSGKSAYPVGRINLNVAFGRESNFRRESLMFEVVKIKSPYHALFRRPAYARFTARPSYVYLKLKMSGPKGTITINGDRKIAQECEEGDAAYAVSACAVEELKFHQANVDPTDMTPLKKPTIDSESPLKFKPTNDTKLVDFVPDNSSKQFTIGTGLDPK
ncbi:hypothetical protein ZWY2020_058127 [Hordeum vulgare]|nr:hypothetical protein ZWY2020_058127 [Hordeum vulgare]